MYFYLLQVSISPHNNRTHVPYLHVWLVCQQSESLKNLPWPRNKRGNISAFIDKSEQNVYLQLFYAPDWCCVEQVDAWRHVVAFAGDTVSGVQGKFTTCFNVRITFTIAKFAGLFIAQVIVCFERFISQIPNLRRSTVFWGTSRSFETRQPTHDHQKKWDFIHDT